MFVVIEKLNGSKHAGTKVVESRSDALLWMAKRVKEIEVKQARQPQDTYITYDDMNDELCVVYDPDGVWMDYRWKVVEML